MTRKWAARVYVEEALAAGGRIELALDKAHHLRNVLRLGVGAPVAAFNGQDGEWMCRIGETGRNQTGLVVLSRLRPPEQEGDVWLMFAPIKRARLDWLIEKATELGVAALAPVWTGRTQAERFNLDRLYAHAVAAAEQSERLSVPELREPRPLGAVLAAWPDGRRLIVCDESGAGEPIAAVVTRLGPAPSALLIGPEGGFTDNELDSLSRFSFVSRVGLGSRVLRAETAALAALSVFQAIAGDWRNARSH